MTEDAEVIPATKQVVETLANHIQESDVLKTIRKYAPNETNELESSYVIPPSDSNFTFFMLVGPKYQRRKVIVRREDDIIG